MDYSFKRSYRKLVQTHDFWQNLEWPLPIVPEQTQVGHDAEDWNPGVATEHATFLEYVQGAIYCRSHSSIVILIFHVLTNRVQLSEAEVSLDATFSNGDRVAEIHFDFILALDDVPHYQAHTFALKYEM